MLRNAAYWGPKAKAAKVVFRYITDVNAQNNAVKIRQVDLGTILDPDLINTCKSNPNFVVTSGSGTEKFDLSVYPLDGPVPELPPSNQSQSTQRLILEDARRENLTIADLARRFADDRRAIVGPPDHDRRSHPGVVRGGRGGRLNVIFPYLPGTLDDFADLVIPELRRRGLFREQYEGRTLRKNLGLPRPASRYAAKQSTAANQRPP